MEPIILNGKYNDAKIFAKTIESELITQCINLLNQEFTKDLKIRIMPDCHTGKGCMIGTTMEIKDKICPNLVGVDISCGMLCVNLGKVNIDFEKFDDVVTKFVPLGAERHTKISKESENFFNKKENKTKANINLEAPKLQIGTLGGGNHFMELDKCEESGEIYLIIHTGSRNFGKQIAEFWQNKAEGESVEDKIIDTNKLIADLKKENRLLEINDKLKKAKEINDKYPYETNLMFDFKTNILIDNEIFEITGYFGKSFDDRFNEIKESPYITIHDYDLRHKEIGNLSTIEEYIENTLTDITLKEDKSKLFLLKHKYLNKEYESFLNIHQHYIKSHNRPILSDGYNTRYYVAELTENLIEELKELYKTDFNEFEKIEVK